MRQPDVECLIYLIVMGLALFGAVAYGVYINYRWMKRIVERKEPEMDKRRSWKQII